jgi:hypothetical protein
MGGLMIAQSAEQTDERSLGAASIRKSMDEP